MSFTTIPLSKPQKLKKTSCCPEVKLAQVAALDSAKTLRSLQSSTSTNEEDINAAIEAKNFYSSALRAAVRSSNSQAARQRDHLLHSVLSSDPRKLQAAVKSSKNAGTPTVHTLQVGKHSYSGDSVPDGFYEALLNLKVPDPPPSAAPDFLSTSEHFRHIIELSKSSPPLPSLSLQETENLLKRVRPHVLDLFSISAHHYSSAGIPGVQHFTSLLNLLICNINLSTSEELNSE